MSCTYCYMIHRIFCWDPKLQDILTFLENYRHLFSFNIQSRIHTQNIVLKFYAASLSWEFNTDALIKRIFEDEIHMACSHHVCPVLTKMYLGEMLD